MTRAKKGALICLVLNLLPILWAVVVIITSCCGCTISDDMYLTIKFMPTIFALTNDGMLTIFGLYTVLLWTGHLVWLFTPLPKKKG